MAQKQQCSIQDQNIVCARNANRISIVSCAISVIAILLTCLSIKVASDSIERTEMYERRREERQIYLAVLSELNGQLTRVDFNLMHLFVPNILVEVETLQGKDLIQIYTTNITVDKYDTFARSFEDFLVYYVSHEYLLDTFGFPEEESIRENYKAFEKAYLDLFLAPFDSTADNYLVEQYVMALGAFDEYLVSLCGIADEQSKTFICAESVSVR